MNKQIVHVHPLLSEDVFRTVCELSRCQDRELDEVQLRRLVQRAVDRSWILHKAIEAGTYLRFLRAWDAQRVAADAVAAAHHDLNVALNNPQSLPRPWPWQRAAISAVEQAERCPKWELASSAIEETVNQTVRDFNGFEFTDRDRLMAVLSPLDGEFVMSAWSMPQNGPGRPPKKDHLECRHFVYEFLTAVDRAGGELGFNKNYDSGPLLDTLGWLKSYLPQRGTEDLSRTLVADVRRR